MDRRAEHLKSVRIEQHRIRDALRSLDSSAVNALLASIDRLLETATSTLATDSINATHDKYCGVDDDKPRRLSTLHKVLRLLVHLFDSIEVSVLFSSS
jgi:hypothetical protein